MTGDLLDVLAAHDAGMAAEGKTLQGWRLDLECGHSFRLAANPAEPTTCPRRTCEGRKRIIAADYLGFRCRSCDSDIPLKDAHGGHYYLCLACRGVRIPARCPYKAGDRVQVHGYPGGRYERDRTGWRGTVEGTMGATILTGIDDDGRDWGEYWGHLDPEGTPNRSVVPCTCCPRAAVQLDLFGAPA